MEDKRKRWKRRKGKKKKDIYCRPRIIKEGMVLTYPVKLKSRKSCLRRLRHFESWTRESRIEIMFLILPRNAFLCIHQRGKKKLKLGRLFKIKLFLFINSKNTMLHEEMHLASYIVI